MFKKTMAVSAILLAVSLAAVCFLLPRAVSDTIRDADKIIGQFVKATPLASYDGKPYTAVEIDIGNTEVYVRQSKDDNIYLRMEGVFADRLNVAATESKQGESTVLTIALGSGDSFYEPGNRPYLIQRLLEETSLTIVELRVPPHIAVLTEKPWQINCDRSVQFANRAYYEGRQWQNGWQADPLDSLIIGPQLETYTAMADAFESDLNTMRQAAANLISASGGAVKQEVLNTLDVNIERTVEQHREIMVDRLFPVYSDVYPLETLTTVLDNYLFSTGQACKLGIQAAISHDGDDSAYVAALDYAQETRDAFSSIYSKYLSSIESALTDGEAPEDIPEEAPVQAGEEAAVPQEPQNIAPPPEV